MTYSVRKHIVLLSIQNAFILLCLVHKSFGIYIWILLLKGRNIFSLNDRTTHKNLRSEKRIEKKLRTTGHWLEVQLQYNTLRMSFYVIYNRLCLLHFLYVFLQTPCLCFSNNVKQFRLVQSAQLLTFQGTCTENRKIFMVAPYRNMPDNFKGV